MKRRIFSVVLLLAMVINFLPICSPVANAVVLAPALTDFDVIGANGWVYVVSQTSGYYYKLSDESGSAPVLDSSDLDGYATKYDITRFRLEECPNGTTKYVQVIKVVSGKIKAWGQKAVTPQPMVEYNGSIDAHGLAITLEQGDNPSKTKIFLDSDKTTPAAIFFTSSILAADPDGAYNLSDIMIYGNRLATNSVTTTSITMNGGSVKSIYGGSGITSSASIVINGGSFIFIRGDGSMGNETHRADIVINGGNVSNTVFTGGAVGVKSGTNSTITVNGGYIRKGYPPYNSAFIEGATPKNSDGDVVKKYILTVKNGGEAVTGAAISALTTYPELGYTYGLADVKTDLNGNLLVFLPEGVSTVSVVADGQTYWGIVTSNAATLMPRSTAPTADVTSITKVTAEQQSVSYTLTNSPQLSGTCTVYADNTTTAPISTVTAAISGSDMTLTSSGADIAAGDYYVAVTETNKSESARLKLTIINIDDADNSEYITGASVAITAPVIGANPQDAAAVQAATNNADYTVTGLVWNGPLTAGDKFKADQIYTATVTLESKNGKKFQAAAFTPTVAGSSSVGTTTTSGGDVIGNTVSFTVTYAATEALQVSSIAMTTQPAKMSYTESTDSVLALNGMQVTETNNDGSTNVVTFTDGTAEGYTTNPANGSTLTNVTHNGIPVVITHTASGNTANTNNLMVNMAPLYGSLSFNNTTYSVEENGGSAIITVNRTGGSYGTVTVDYQTSDGTATVGSDYTGTSGTLSFADEENNKTITINISDDTNYEGNETVTLTLSNPSGGAVLGEPNSAELTIIDNEEPIADITAASVNITAPILGEVPQNAAAVQDATSHADYTVTGLVWNEALTADGKFKASQVYTATVTLTSKNDKKFQVAAFTPTVAGSSSVGTTTTFGGDVVGNTVSFIVTFAATGNGSGGGSGNSTPVPPPPAPVITVSEVKSELFSNAEDIKVEADVTSAFGQSVEVKITDSTESQNEVFQLAGADDRIYPFDISLYSRGSDEKVQPKDGYSVKITLPVPEKLLEDKELIKVVYGKEGKLETLKSELIEKDGKWYIIFEANHFSPYALIVSAEPSVSWTNPFSDINEGDRYYSAVQYVAQNGLMLGTESNTFSPQLTTNRGMIATILYRLHGSVETSKSTFKDVIPGAYYAKAVAWAQNNGIIAGYGNGMFGPEDNITREQMATILWKYAGSPVADTAVLTDFKDTGEISAYAKDSLTWAYSEGIIAGKGNGILDPKGYATRAEVAQIMYNFKQKADEIE